MLGAIVSAQMEQMENPILTAQHTQTKCKNIEKMYSSGCLSGFYNLSKVH